MQASETLSSSSSHPHMHRAVLYKKGGDEASSTSLALEIFGTKATLKMVGSGKIKVIEGEEGGDKKKPKSKYKKWSKRGFGWSGCTNANKPHSFWVASDNYRKSLFRIDFESGAADKFKLSHHHANLEGVSSAHQLFPDEEVLFIACSCSTNHKGDAMKPDSKRNRISLLRVPTSGTDTAEGRHFKKGKNMFVWSNVRGSITARLTAQADDLNVAVDDSLPAKHGGLDIEGVSFVHSSFLPAPPSGEKAFHILWLGLRGPITRDGHALLVPVHLPVDTVHETETWSVHDVVRVDLGGDSVRDLHFDEDTRKMLILAGPLRQDKAESKIVSYGLFVWDPIARTSRAKRVADVPRLRNKKLEHSGMRVPHAAHRDRSEEHDEALERNKEKVRSLSSPEGICKFGDRLLVCWDNNDVGVYALFHYPTASEQAM